MPTEEGPGHVLEARIFNNKLVVYGRTMLNEYLSYFSPEFLVENSAKPLRYFIPNTGLVTYAGFGLLVVGLIALGQDSGVGMWWLLLLAAPLPSIITDEDIPNLMRTLLMVPFIVIIESYGLCFLMEIKHWGKILSIIVMLAWGINLIWFFHMYYRHEVFSIASYYRDGGNVELAEAVEKLQNNYANIYLPNYPDSLYPWIAYFDNKDPLTFNRVAMLRKGDEWNFENISFTDQHCPTDVWLKNQTKNKLPTGKILVVNAEGCEVDKNVATKNGFKYLETIHRPDGSPPYMLWERE
jgi:hypothetical protein